MAMQNRNRRAAPSCAAHRCGPRARRHALLRGVLCAACCLCTPGRPWSRMVCHRARGGVMCMRASAVAGMRWWECVSSQACYWQLCDCGRRDTVMWRCTDAGVGRLHAVAQSAGQR